MQNPWLNCESGVFAFFYDKAVVLLGRLVRYCMVGTTTDFFDKADKLGEIHQIRNADVYWGDNGGLIVVASEKWKKYLQGESNDIPDDEDSELEYMFEFDEQMLVDMLSG